MLVNWILEILFQYVRYKAEADEMWEHASEDVRQTYGRDYLFSVITEKQRKAKSGSTTTKPVIDALIDGLISDTPQTRYLVDGGTSFLDVPAVKGLSHLRFTSFAFKRQKLIFKCS